MTLIIIFILVLGFIGGGILILKQTAKKFHLTEEQRQAVKKRQIEQEQKDQQQK